MSKTAKIISGIVAVVVIIIIVVSGGNKNESGTIKIGISLPLTGDLGFIGETNKNAAEMAIDEITKNKDLKYKYELVFEDDSFDAARVVTVMNKFLSIDKVDAVISVGSTAGNVVSPLAEKNKMPHIGLASDANVAKGEYNFIHWTRPEEQVVAMISELQKRQMTKVAVISVNQQGHQVISDDFKQKAKAAGITVNEQIFNTGTTDFKTIISKLQKDNPQIYLLGSFDPETGIIGKQIRDLGINTPLTSIESFGITADPKPFEGQWFVDAASPTSDFVANYQARYMKSPGPAAPNIYDTIYLIVNSFESVSTNSKPTAEQVVKALSNQNGYNGALGKLAVSSDGAFISQATVKIIKDGKVVDLK
jgi:branched-chain amino acid transport system substrate-binding protein